jgi:hypothetical protein
MSLEALPGVSLPTVHVPMAGVQDGALAVAVSNAGGLGSLPGALLEPDALRRELEVIRAQTTRPYNVNVFCHTPPKPSVEGEAAWQALLAPYFAELGVDPGTIQPGPGRLPFTREAAGLLVGRAEHERMRRGTGGRADAETGGRLTNGVPASEPGRACDVRGDRLVHRGRRSGRLVSRIVLVGDTSG